MTEQREPYIAGKSEKHSFLQRKKVVTIRIHVSEKEGAHTVAENVRLLLDSNGYWVDPTYEVSYEEESK